MKHWIYTLALLIGAWTTLFAQEVYIDTVEVSTLNIPLKLSETGRSITVLDQKAIHSINAQSIDELLQFVTGVEVQSRGAFGVQGDIVMRGSTFTQVLILVNGMRINDPLTGHFNGYIPVAMADVERIEILRGAASAMYGPDAVGGVINIVSKTFSKKDFKDAFSGSVGLGDYGLRTADLGFFDTDHKLRIAGGLSYREADGQNIRPQSLIDDVELESYNSFFNIRTGNLSMGYNFNDKLSLMAFSSYDHRNFDARYFYTVSNFDKSVETVQNSFNMIKLDLVGDRTATDINVAYKRNTDEFVFSPDFPSTNFHTTEYLNMMANHMVQWQDNWTVKTGVQVDKRSIESNDRGNHEDWHYGVYGLLAFAKSNINAYMSLRADHDDNYGFKILPGFNLSYRTDKLILRTSMGRSIRAADYTERYVSNNLSNLTPGRNLGNPYLNSEQAWSGDFGIDYYLSRNWRISASLYTRVSDNLIDYILTDADQINVGDLQEGGSYLFASNIAEVNTYGLEFESQMNRSFRSGAEIDWTLSYSYNKNDIDEDINSVYLNNAAQHLLSNHLRLRSGRASIGVSTLFKERNNRNAPNIDLEFNEAVWLVNADFSYRVISDIKLVFSVMNAGDVRYQNILGAQMPGRWMMTTLEWNL